MSPFICLEGVDAVGKTAISQSLAARLGYQYYKSPGPEFASVRDLVDLNVDPITRYFFYRAATQYDSRCISKALEISGVVCDRYIYSTFAFHRAMDGQIQSLFELTQLVMPNYTFVLTADENIRKARLLARAEVKELESNLTLQRRSDRIFRSFGHPVVDTSYTTVEEATDILLSYIEKGSTNDTT
jgi:thymidylate kinase